MGRSRQTGPTQGQRTSTALPTRRCCDVPRNPRCVRASWYGSRALKVRPRGASLPGSSRFRRFSWLRQVPLSDPPCSPHVHTSMVTGTVDGRAGCWRDTAGARGDPRLLRAPAPRSGEGEGASSVLVAVRVRHPPVDAHHRTGCVRSGMRTMPRAEEVTVTRQHECPGCGEPVPSIWASIVHCDPVAYIDDDNVERGVD